MHKSQKINKSYEKTIKTMAKGAGIGLLGLFLGRLFAYLTRMFIARTMGPDAYGLLSIGLAIASVLVTFSLLGLDVGLTRFVAFYKGKGSLGKVKGSIFSSFKITVPLGIFFSVLLFLLSERIAVGFFSKQDLTPVIQLMSFSILPSVLSTISDSTLMGFKLIKSKVFTTEIGKNLSTLLFVVAFFYLGLSLFGATTGFLLGFVTSCVIGLYYVRSKILPGLGSRSFSMSREILSFSWPLFLVYSLSMVLSWTDVLMLGYFDTATNVGIYSACLNLCMLLTFVYYGFGFIFVPLISEFYSKNKIDEIRGFYKISTRWIFSIVFPIFLLLVFFPDNILEIMFGQEFIPGYLALIILSLGFVVFISVGLSRETVVVIGKPKVVFYITVVSAVSNFILNLVLIPIYSMVGAAIAMSVSMVIWGVLPLIYVNRKIGVQPYDINYIKPMLASISAMTILYLIIKNNISPSWPVLLAGFLVFIFLYGLLILIMKGLRSEDILIFKTLEAKTGLRIGWLREIMKKFIR